MGEARRTPRQSARGSDPSVLTARDSASKSKSHHLPTGHFQGPFSSGETREQSLLSLGWGGMCYTEGKRGAEAAHRETLGGDVSQLTADPGSS